MGVVGMFKDGEIISSIIITPKEMREDPETPIDNKDLTKYIYANMAISLNIICPKPIDEEGCFTITSADFNWDSMELHLYWNFDDNECELSGDENDLREQIREYIGELIKYEHEQLLALEEHTTMSPFKRSEYPVKVTIECSSPNGLFIRESILSTDVTIN